jgi:hypothetical protein
VLALDIALKALLVGLLVFAVARPDLPQFAGKAMTGRAIAYPLATLIVPVAWWLVRRRRPVSYPWALDILLVLPFLIDTGGNALNLYDTIEWWDDANHFVNWALQTAAVGLVLRYAPWSWRVRAAMGFAYAVTAAVLWEFMEYVTFVPNSPEAASAYADTLGDIALGMLGGLPTAIGTARMSRLTTLGERLRPPSS